MNVSFAQSHEMVEFDGAFNRQGWRYLSAVATHDRPIDIPVGLLHDGLIIASRNKRIRALAVEMPNARAKQETKDI